MSLLETQDPVSPIGSMSLGGICVLVGDYYDTILYNTLDIKIQECDSLDAIKYKVVKSFM